MEGSESVTGSFESASTEEDEEEQDHEGDPNSHEESDELQLMFLTMRGPVIKILHAFLKAKLVLMSPSLDADTATLEEFREAFGSFSMDDIMTHFKKTIDDSIPKKQVEDKETIDNPEPKEESDDPAVREQCYKDITLVSKDVSFYAKILRVFFKDEFVDDKKYPSLKKIVDLRNGLSHYTKDGTKVTLDEVQEVCTKALKEIRNNIECSKSTDFLWELESELKFHNMQRFSKSYAESMASQFPDKSELLVHAKDETAILNNRCGKNNLLTWLQQLQVSEFLRDGTLSDVFVCPVMTFKDQPLDDLSEVFSDEDVIGDCTGLRAVLLSGPSGAGKSTLAHRLVHSWLEGSSPHLDKFDVVFMIDMNNAQHSDIFSCLREVMPRTMKEIKHDNLIQSFSDLNILLVIDGFDARYPKRLQLLRNICDKFRRSYALLISSPDSLSAALQSFSSVADGVRPVVKVTGFDSKRCENFANNVLKIVQEEDKRTELSQKFQLIMDHRQSLFPCQREYPRVVCLSLMILFLDPNVGKELFENDSKIFHVFFAVLRKLLKSNRCLEKSLSNVPLDDELLLMCGEIGLQKLQSDGRIEIFAEDVNSIDLKSTSFDFCLLNHKMESGSDAAFSFCATAVMHYLAALFLSSEVKTNKRSLHSYFKQDCCLFKELLPHLVRDSYLLENFGDEIFEIALAVKKRTNPGDIYTFWHDIFSQADFNSNTVLCERVTDILRDSEWNLDEETLVPAAGLLKFCKPGVTEKLKIKLIGSDTNNNGVLLQHLRQRLRESYDNDDSPLLLSLDLGLPDVASSCAWLEDLEEPFLRLVGFTAHVDAESVLILRHCRHLSRVTLRLSTLDSFNKFTECYEACEYLETVKLHVCFLDLMFEKTALQVKRLSSKVSNSEPLLFELTFDGLESKLLPGFVSLLQNILPSNQDFFMIILLNTSLNYADARKLLSTKFFVDGRLDVKSTYSLSAEEKDCLKAEAFRDDDGLHQWPFFQFSWNGRYW